MSHFMFSSHFQLGKLANLGTVPKLRYRTQVGLPKAKPRYLNLVLATWLFVIYFTAFSMFSRRVNLSPLVMEVI